MGAAAFWEVEQKDVDKAMEMVIEAGVNHIDVAPSYGQAEERIKLWMTRERERFFPGCKTMERTQEVIQLMVDDAPKVKWYFSDGFDAYARLWYHYGRYEVSQGKNDACSVGADIPKLPGAYQKPCLPMI